MEENKKVKETQILDDKDTNNVSGGAHLVETTPSGEKFYYYMDENTGSTFECDSINEAREKDMKTNGGFKRFTDRNSWNDLQKSIRQGTYRKKK